MKKTVKEFCKEFRQPQKIIDFLVSKKGERFLEVEMEHWEFPDYSNWYFENVRFDLWKYTKNEIFPPLLKKRKPHDFLLATGNDGYSAVMHWMTLKECSNRVGGIEKPIDVVFGCLEEYIFYSDNEKETLVFDIIKRKEAVEKGLIENENIRCSYAIGFFDRLKPKK